MANEPEIIRTDLKKDSLHHTRISPEILET
jgi:hypothetical protein